MKKPVTLRSVARAKVTGWYDPGEIPKRPALLPISPGKNQSWRPKGGDEPSPPTRPTDIYVGAFFLCKGAALRGIRIKDAARGIAAFEISGADLEGLERQYRSGHRPGEPGASTRITEPAQRYAV